MLKVLHEFEYQREQLLQEEQECMEARARQVLAEGARDSELDRVA